MNSEINKRRTFAIISHPDAGKTTLTEKLLLFGGAINLAGAVKAKGKARHAKSDWMKVEQERGISVASSVMSFMYDDIRFNLLDTPGHEDFSEDTYRVLSAVDSSIMVIDSAKGIEKQTQKLFEICRLREIPITTFINKLDREGRDPFELIDEIEKTLQLDVVPITWPIGMGSQFLGCYNLLTKQIIFMDKSKKSIISHPIYVSGLDDKKISSLIPEHLHEKLKEDIEIISELCPKFNIDAFLEGYQTPLYFGSAVNNFGVIDLLNGIKNHSPSPMSYSAKQRDVYPDEKKVSGFIFKIQANLDPKHRNRIAYFRICSGHFKKGQKLNHVRTKKVLTIHNPTLFFAQEREIAEKAFAGDIIGIPNHGNFKIGDTLAEEEHLNFKGVPDFAPELLNKIRSTDPLKAKHLSKALIQIAEEGAIKAFKLLLSGEWIIGAIGQLQFEILSARLKSEYSVNATIEASSIITANWITGKDNNLINNFIHTNRSSIAYDIDNTPVFLARNNWHLETAIKDNKQINFLNVREFI